MKKFFSIVLAAAMVLSLGTAFASTWSNNDANTDTAAAVSISVTKYTILTDAAGASYYSQLDDAAIVKAGDDVAFQVKIVVPSAGSLNNQFGSTVFESGDILNVKIDGTNLASGTDISFGTLTIALTDSAETYYLYKTATATTPTIVDSAAMYLDTAYEYGAVGLKVNVKFQSDLDEIAIKSGDYKYYVTDSETTATALGTTGGTVYSVYSTYRSGAYVHFVTSSSSSAKVVEIYAEVDGVIMKIVKTDGVYQCSTTAVVGTYSDSVKYAADDFLNVVLSVLGFSAYDALYSGSIYMDDTNWAQNYGVYFNNSNNATYAAYTYVPVTATVVTTTTTDIPKTGSNASVIGFAMVALAVIAAAVVAVKKVRA